MKLYNIFLLAVAFLIVYNWIYEKYLYEITFVKYLPNYDKEVVFPIYRIGNSTPIYPEAVSKDKIASDDLLSYVPLHGKVMYYLSAYTVLLDPFLFLLSLLSGFIIFFQKKMFSKYKWWIIQVILFAIMFFILINTQIMD